MVISPGVDGSRSEARAGRDASAPSFDLVGALPAVVWEADAENESMLFVSSRARTIVGHDPGTWTSDPGFWDAHVHPDDLGLALESIRQAVATGEPRRIEYRFQLGDGRYRWFQDTIQVVPGEDGRPKLVGVMVDVHEERLRREEVERVASGRGASPDPDLVASSPLHQAIVDNLSDGVYYVDRQRTISYWNHGAERLTGYLADDVIGRHCYDNILVHVDGDGRNLCHSACPLMQTIADGRERQHLVWLRHADGHRVPVETRTAPIHSDETGLIVGGVEIFSDATGLVEARDAVDAARRDALTDPLTGLPNRRLLDAVLGARKDDLDRHRLPFGFLMADVDHFKRFNDDYGHDVGDQALRVVAATLKGALRSGDTIVRWGGEEFAVVAAQVDAAALHRLAERLLRLVRATHVPTATRRVPITISIGGAMAHPGEPLDALFVRADRALLAAKAAGRDRFVLNEPAPERAEPRQFGARW